MESKKTGTKSLVKKLLIAGFVLFVLAAGIGWCLFNRSFDDTATIEADFTVNALDLIKEFKQNDSAANKKYSEKIITVNGRVSSIEGADTTLNIRMDDSSGSYVIFAFQPKEIKKIKKIKQGDSISVKGSCSGGTYSDILETEFITFKRSTLNR